MRLAENHRILFVNVLRPGYKDVDEMIVRFIKDNLMRNYLQIILEPLDTKSSQTLIRNMLNVKSINHSFFNQIVERASGNPFFIEEVIRSFIDEGILTVKGETLEIAENISDVTIPYTINDLLMARIDRLEERTISLLKTASVIGRSFFYRLISDVASAIDDIDNRLSYLKEIQLIREESRREEIEYLFKHALAQEAVYSSILKKKRKALHLKVAESIEKIYENRKHEFYGMLAYHYGKAEHLAKAEEYMILAGEEALKSSASAEALDYYQRAFDIYLSKYGKSAEPKKLLMFEKNIALALFYNGAFLKQ